MSIVEIPCANWIEFRTEALPKVFNQNSFVRGRFYFRGQSQSSFGLKSSFDRWYSAAGLAISKVEAAKALIDAFQEERANSIDPPGPKETHDEIIALAQHYGIPTRLLDWSESPYIAAFFAFANFTSTPDPNSRVAVWCLDTQHSIWKDDKGVSVLSITSPYNERLKSQLGKFTLLQSPFDTVEEHISHCRPSATVIGKITIPSSEANHALSDLDFMGVNYSTIFKGTDGCARAAITRVLLQQQKRVPKKAVAQKKARRKRRPIKRLATKKIVPLPQD